jgi:hypothetical protein
MALKNDRLKALIHEFGNFVHVINMELDLAERRSEKVNSADPDLLKAVDYMTCSLEDLRLRLVRIRDDGHRDCDP